jgi:hypothetical protein
MKTSFNKSIDVRRVTREDLEYRKEVADKIGLGFVLPMERPLLYLMYLKYLKTKQQLKSQLQCNALNRERKNGRGDWI